MHIVTIVKCVFLMFRKKINSSLILNECAAHLFICNRQISNMCQNVIIRLFECFNVVV